MSNPATVASSSANAIMDGSYTSDDFVGSPGMMGATTSEDRAATQLSTHPTAAPLAMFQVRGELIDLTNNQILWRASTAQKQNLVAIEGNWDQPPDYPNLTQAILRAEHDAVVYLQNASFSDAH